MAEVGTDISQDLYSADCGGTEEERRRKIEQFNISLISLSASQQPRAGPRAQHYYWSPDSPDTSEE